MCFSGTPYTIRSLSPYARTVVASPDNLHLSYFDLAPLARLDIGPEEGGVKAYAERFARNAFDRLSRDVQTAVSVAVYDVGKVQPFLRSVSSVYERDFFRRDARRTDPGVHCDCAEEPAYLLPAMRQGVEVFYRSARFGRAKNKDAHSGWECWRQEADDPSRVVFKEGIRVEDQVQD
jgi:hypothetical protein